MPSRWALQHHRALELRDSSENLQHQRAGGSSRVEVHAQDAQPCTLGFDLINDGKEVAHGSRHAVKLRANQNITIAQVVECCLELFALCDAAHLFGEDLLATGCCEVLALGIEASDLINRGSPCVADLHRHLVYHDI
jgi:hypothetical protein